MQQTSFKNIKDYLKCIACSELNNTPLLLPCQHSFCKTCITSSYNDEHRRVKCLTCNEEIKISFEEIDKLQRGVFIDNKYYSFEGLDLLFKLRPNISNYWILENSDIIFVDNDDLFIKYRYGNIIQSINSDSGIRIQSRKYGIH